MKTIKNLNNFLVMSIFLLATLCTAAAGGTLYVNTDGSGGAFTSIQAAINVAANGDEIEVAPGTYLEAINFNGKAVRLYSTSGPDVTTIDGTGHFHVVQCVSGEGPGTMLEGFTITGGNANGASYPDNGGGGMYNSSSSPTVTNCTFTGNSADKSGGGMFNYFCSLTVRNCTFSGNSAASYHGGGMYTMGGSPTVTNCTFSGNSANCDGGGMANFYCSATATNCTFSENSADFGGGMFNFYASSIMVTNCILWGNTGPMGSQIYNSSSTPVVTYSDVQGGYTGTGNINADPMFADADGRLLPGSPCIDAGDNSAVTVTTDLDGNPRIVGLAVDMGAYEFQEPLQHAAAKTERLVNEVETLELPGGIENSLVSKLENAIDSIQKGQANAAVNKLEAYINQVEAQRGKKISEADADALIADAQQIIDLLMTD